MGQRDVVSQEIEQAKRRSMDYVTTGFLWGRPFEDGRCLYLAPSPMTPMRWLLGLARDMAVHSYYAVWEYEADDLAAWEAAIAWDGSGEPKGYKRRVLVPEEFLTPP